MWISGKTQERLAKEYFLNLFLTRSKIKAIYRSVFLNAQREVGILIDALYCVNLNALLFLKIKLYNKIILLIIFSAS